MAKQKKEETTTELPMKSTAPAKDYIGAVGRRKEAVARVRLYPKVKEGFMWQEKEVKKGDIWVNGIAAEHYFAGVNGKMDYTEILRVTNALNRFAITVRVTGGGKKGQLDAMIHGIARALSAFDKDTLRPILKKKKYLTRDSRVRERRKVGTGGKARRKKQSPKR